MADSDATIEFEPNEVAFLKGVDRMASGAEGRFQRLGHKLASVFGAVFSGGSGTSIGGGNWSQTPMAKTTKEMEAQSKWSREILKLERERIQIARAERFAANRAKYGEGARLDEHGNLDTREEERVWRKEAAKRQQRFARMRSFASGAIGTMTSMSNSRQDQGLVQAGSFLASQIAPELGPIISAIAGAFMSALNKRDTARDAVLSLYQSGGSNAIEMEGQMDGLRKGLGFKRNEYAQLYARGMSSGALGMGRDYNMARMEEFMRTERGFGAGGNMMGLVGAANRTGSADSVNGNLSGTAFGLMAQQGLMKGRFGEVLDQLTRAIEQNTMASTDVQATADRFLFISQLGAQYRGDQAASRAMDSSLKGLASGGRPFTDMTSLQAAGFGQPGVSYAEAWLSSQKGLDTQGGINNEKLIATNFGQYVSAYATGGKAQKASIVLTLSKLTGMNGAQVESILERLSKGPLGKVDRAQGARRFTAHSGAPANALRGKVDDATSEDIMRFGVGNMSDAGDLQDPGPGGSAVGSSSLFMGSVGSQGRFGVQRDNTPFHPGIDSNQAPGTPVYSKVDGVCVRAYTGKGIEFGYHVFVETNDGYIWKAMHMDPASRNKAVGVGKKVHKGQFLGKVAKMRHSHLHVGVVHKGAPGVPLNPESFGGLDDFINPSATGAAGGAGPMFGSSEDSPITSPTQLPSAGSRGGGAVRVEIIDSTRNGVQVQSQQFADDAAKPAPGDASAGKR